VKLNSKQKLSALTFDGPPCRCGHDDEVDPLDEFGGVAKDVT
jgi:hypothetical protein